jgi:hypothetical protein
MNQSTDSADVTLCHPEWPAIRNQIGRVFVEPGDTYQWALDAVIAHQLKRPERSREALRHIGAKNAERLQEICRPYNIDLSSNKAA